MKLNLTNGSFLFFGTLVYFLLLFWVDLRFITTHYEYSGFVNSFEIIKFILSLFTILLFSLLLKTNSKSYSAYFYKCIIMFLVLVPSLVHFSVTGGYYFYFVTVLACFVVFLVLYLKLPSLHLFSFNSRQLVKLLTMLVVLFIVSIVLMGGWRYFNLDLLKVYEYRRSAAANLPSTYVYWGSIISKIITPVIIVLSLQNKMRVYTFVAIVCAVLQFALLAHKGVLFNPFVAIFVYFFLNKADVIKYILWGLITVCLFSVIDFYLYEFYPQYSSGLLSSLFARRALMVPPLLNDFFIQFFSENKLYYWCASKVSLGLLGCPYEVTAPFVIGQEFFGNIKISANTGWIGAGFSNMRLGGVVFYSVLLGLILALLSAFERKLGRKVVVTTSLLIVFNLLTSTDIFTGFFTHGLFYLFLIYLILPRKSL